MRAGPAIGLAFGILGWIIAGPVYALAFGLLAALVVGLALGIGQQGTEESPSDPLSCWRNDRNFGLVVGIAVMFVAGLGLGLTLGRGLLYGLVAGLVAGLVGGLFYPDTWRTAVACGQLRLAGHTPLRLMRFLEDAYARNVLRTVGPVYQFRHASLQDRLAGPLVVKIRDVQWENWRNIALIAALHVEITNTTDRSIRLGSFTFTTGNPGKPPWEDQVSADERIAVEREIHARQVGFRYGLSLRNHDEYPRTIPCQNGWLRRQRVTRAMVSRPARSSSMTRSVNSIQRRNLDGRSGDLRFHHELDPGAIAELRGCGLVVTLAPKGTAVVRKD